LTGLAQHGSTRSLSVGHQQNMAAIKPSKANLVAQLTEACSRLIRLSSKKKRLLSS
jgi:hypothetical protein